jgi:hypothetical protein
MGKHAQEPMTSRNAKTGEVHDLAYWHRMLVTAQTEGYPMHTEMIYKQIDRLLDEKLATR